MRRLLPKLFTACGIHNYFTLNKLAFPTNIDILFIKQILPLNGCAVTIYYDANSPSVRFQNIFLDSAIFNKT